MVRQFRLIGQVHFLGHDTPNSKRSKSFGCAGVQDLTLTSAGSLEVGGWDFPLETARVCRASLPGPRLEQHRRKFPRSTR